MKRGKPHPFLLCVTGLKNSGKTTVCTALIADLTACGLAVAALKSSHISRLNLDHRSGDSYALAEAGARFVMVQGPEESLILERGGRSFARMLERVPEGVAVIVSEGGDPGAADGVIVCLGDAADWRETLRVRRVPRKGILAVSGSFSAGAVDQRSFEGYPVFDVARDEQRRTLADRIIAAGSTAGPRTS